MEPHFLTFETKSCQSWLDLLALRALAQGDKIAFAHVTAIEAEPITITYAQLQQRAQAVGDWLRKENMLGQRVVIALPSGIDYVVMFFGCQYAECIPVTVYPPNPKNKNNMSRFQGILIDAEPAMIFCQAKDMDVLQTLRNENDRHLFRIQCIEELPTDSVADYPAPVLRHDDIAFLQYTSGSTSSPKGVMVSHFNLMHNSQLMARCMGFSATSIVASWLPMHHDMGLIGKILCSLYVGASCYFILPASFVQRPFLWLKMISDYRCTISGAPNFAYDLCSNRITEEEKATLDLSCWTTAWNGSEPTSATTVRRFAEEFSVCGFSYDAILPCYGLAEATLVVTGKLKELTPVVKFFQREALRQGKAVGSTSQDSAGDPYLCHGNIVLADQRLEIVDPNTHQLCREGEVGEIWTAGGSKALGYWNREEESKQIFASTLANGDKTAFLRTGDLGFIHHGGLYISGRIKDIFIVNGQNVYPQDVERVIEDHFSDVLDRCAVVSAQQHAEMADVLVEVKRVRRRSLDFASTAQAISGKIALEFGLPLASVTFLQSGHILRTTSGKIQRSANRAALAAGELAIMHRWLRQPETSADKPAASIGAQVLSLAAKVLQVPPESISAHDEIGILGFTSLSFAELSAYLNEHFGLELTAAAMFEYATLQDLIDSVQSLSHAATVEVAEAPAPEIACDAQSSASAMAIIGVGGRMPRCADLAEFAEKLLADADLLGPVPEQRWPHEAWPSAQKRGGFLLDIAGFDAAFFKMTPHEAQLLDPQQRLFLEAAWCALEDAGYRPSDFAGRAVGVFVGVSTNDYKSVLRDAGQLAQDVSITGTTNSNIANRVSYFFNFSGPSEVIDTACSSSLCALHRAMDALKNGDCELALVGGVSALLHAEIYQSLAEAGMLSPDERCMSFDQRANGYVRGEGVAAIVLQPISAAKAMRANIRALVLGSAVNHGGKVNTLTTPNPNAQAALLQQAYARAEVEPQHIGYIETHGTGTNLGDPIEINGLKKAFIAMLGDASLDVQSEAFCGIGSVKANIGHLEAAAGIAGVLKVLIAMQHRRLPGMPHFQQLNPQIQLQNSPFYIVDKCRPWLAPRNAQGKTMARVAGVSSFGFGGSNAHVVLQEYSAAEPTLDDGTTQLFVFSADSENALQALLQAMANAIRQRAPTLSDLAYTLALGREVFSLRLAVCANNRDQLLALLDTWLSGERKDWHQGLVKRNAEAVSPSPGLQTALARKDWPVLAAAWVEGVELPWTELLDGQRINLPGYPFARKSYWVQPARILPEMPQAEAQCLMVRSYWQTAPHVSVGEADDSALTIVAPAAMVNRLHEADPVAAQWLTLPSAADNAIAAAIHSDCVFLLNTLQTLLRDKRRQRILLLLPEDGSVYFRYAPLVAMLQTANLEAPHLQTKVLRVASKLPGLAECLQQETMAQFGATVQVRVDANGQRTLLQVEEFVLPQPTVPGRIKDDGCYWITGGLGGLGQQLARWLSKQPGRRIVLSGRAAADQRTGQLLKELAAQGAQVHYLQADLADADSVAASLQQIEALAGKVDGIFHTAGLLRDGLLSNKTAADLQQVLQPKVDAVLALAAAIKDAPSDFVLLFSSLSALCGNAGQADYAAANAFMDAFADAQQQQGTHWLSIAWPFWRDGGMQLDADMLDVLFRQKGLRPMPVERGLSVLEQALASPLRQFAVLYGQKELMLHTFVEQSTSAPARPAAIADAGQSPAILKALVVNALKELFQEITSIPQQDVDETLPLEDFGLNSVMVVRFNSRFEEVFGKLSHTLLYEYQTIDSLADYLVQTHAPACSRWATKMVSGIITPAADVAAAIRQTMLNTVLPITDNRTDEPIAIIGLAGRYPEARDLEQFWQNLLAGRDSVGEIPPERWPLEGFFLADRTEAVKQGKSYSKWGGFIDGYDEFDALFFNISPKEARSIDPQERLFLECCWSCIEDAGHTRDSLRNYRVGVFAGITKTGFELHGAELPPGEGIYPLTSFGSLANRVSYFFNFQGPSMPIDTMCSSSLTAIHEACQHIRSGECEVALAGGVNLYSHPMSYIRLSAKQFLAEDGCSRSFGSNGTGFVPGEGVGAVLLKSLRQAVADGDHIHGLILGSAINHGGKTNGYTTPNPVAQGDLIRSALQRAGVKAEQISYIEAHGTGTALGDPIEINGLSRAFEPDTSLKQFCRIGSVKSNIGHGEAAAGIAGVSKILLQMKHEMLVPSLHAEQLNPNIDFVNSPFLVQRDRTPWLPEQANGKTRPRIAGISSFGAGGANAHLVMQDYPEQRAAVPSNTLVCIVPFSARNEAALKAMLRTISEFLKRADMESLALQNIAFTLQTGREAMEMRAVFLTVSLDELHNDITRFLNGETAPARFLSGRVRKASKSALPEHAAPHELASAWVAGEAVDWTRLYRHGLPLRISLPGYVFAREALPVGSGKHGLAYAGQAQLKQRIGPLLTLLHPRATLEAAALVYEGTIRSTMPLLDQHKVYGRPMFPGTGSIEMMLEAAQQAFPTQRIRLVDVFWAQPIQIDEEEQRVHVQIVRDGEHYLIRVCSADSSASCVYAQAQIEIAADPAPENIVQPVQTHLPELWPDASGAQRFYQQYHHNGVAYGPYFRALRRVCADTDQAFAYLELDEQFQHELNEYVLHPVILDNALQCAGLIVGTHQQCAYLPSAMAGLTQYAALQRGMFVLLKKRGELRFDLKLVAPDGQVCVVCDDFRVRPMQDPLDRLLFAARWQRSPATGQVLPSEGTAVVLYAPSEAGFARHLAGHFSDVQLFAIGDSNRQLTDAQQTIEARDPDALRHALKAIPHLRQIFVLTGLDATQADSFDLNEGRDEQERTTLTLYRTVRALLESKLGESPLQLTVLTQNTRQIGLDSAQSSYGAGLIGLTKSMSKEFPAWQVRLLDLDQAELQDPAQHARLSDAILREAPNPNGDQIVLRAGYRYQCRLYPVQLPANKHSGIRHGGVYLILGGAGGLGYATSEYLAREYQAQVIWLGRSAPDQGIDQKIAALAQYGKAPLYLQVDACDLDAMRAAQQEIHHYFPKIHGVIHSAIVLRDKSLQFMEEQGFREALTAKTETALNLLQVFATENPDWFCFYSSLQSFVGSPGQSNYAAGCTFKDALARRFAQQSPIPVIILNWGYWGEIGVVASDDYRQQMRRRGIGSLDAAEGMAVLERTLAQGNGQWLVFKAEPATLKQYGFDSTLQLQQLPPSIQLPPFGSLVQREAEMTAMVEFNRGNAAVDSLCYSALLQMFSRWGWQQEQGAQSLSQLRQRFGVIDKYQRLFEGILQMLQDIGAVQGNRHGYLRTAPTEPFELAQAAQDLRQAYPGFSAHIDLLQDCLEALPEVLRGNILATDVIFPGSSLHKVTSLYHDNPVVDYFNRRVADCVVARIEQLAAMLKAGEKIRILEVGAGTGGTSAVLFRALQQYEHQLDYVYSDVSRSFLLHAQQKFAPSVPYMRTCIIDVEQPVTKQHIDTGSFDILLGTNVLHAVNNIADTLNNLKPALKNGGLLLVNEMANVQCFSTLTFGLLDGWWKYEDEEIRMPGSPGLAPQQWQRLLAETGFVGTQLVDGNTANHGQQVYMAESDGLILQAVSAVTINKKRADSAHTPSHAHVQHPVASVTPMTETEQAAKLQQTLITAVAQALQVAADQVEPDRPLSELGVDSIIGVSLVQTINKALGLSLQTTVLFDYPSVQALLQHIQTSHAASLIKHQAAVSPSQPAAEPVVASSTGGTLMAEGYYKLVVHGPGTIDDLQWLPQQMPNAPGPTQVVIENRAFSLNFGDLLCVKGMYPSMPPYPFTPGFESSGVVLQAGSQVHDVQPGDEVIVLGGAELGCQANLLMVEQDMLLRKPAGLDHEQACALPAVLLTVVEIFRRAQLRQGETILIQTAAGGIGLIAVQYALSKRAKIIATCGSEYKRQYLLGLGVTHVINYVEQDFEQEVRRLTAGAGVDIVLNTLAGEAMQKGLHCLARRGRYIEIAMTALKSARNIDLSGLSNNQSYYSIDLRKLGLEEHDYLKDLWNEALEWLAAGIIKPTISQVFPQQQLHAAYRHLEQRTNIGKVVVRLAQQAKIRTDCNDSAVSHTGKARQRDNAIAIIGMSGAFAEADRLDRFWAALEAGQNLVREVPAERWSSADYYDPQAGKDGKTNCKWGGFLNGVDCFDPMFFRISALEAENMDPQQRLFLQHAWNAIEDAAIVPSSLAGSSCGVFVAAADSDYPALQQQGRDASSFWGHANSVIGARVAYFLDLHGPAITVDTACSGSLVAVHLAYQSLLSGETDSVLTGGVFMQATPEFYLYASRAGMLSPDGCCYAFDDRANGFVPGEGVGVLLLKRLADAQRDGDPIHGVIRASSVNQDGRTNGLTAPSGLSQRRLQTGLLQANGIHPEQVQYCEAHGTGTALGDPIEFNALCESFSDMTDKKQFCALGSVKTNIGHAASAAGVAGIIKVLLAMRRGVIPASLHFEHANPKLNLEDSPFYIPTTSRPWPQGQDGMRRALVSSFGFGGTNAMLCLEQHPIKPQVADRLAAQQQIVPLSAKTVLALRQRVQDLLQHLQAEPDIALADCALSLQQGREQMAVQVSFAADTMIGLKQQLAQFLAQTTEQTEAETLAQWQAQGDPANYGRRIHLPGYRFAQERYWPAPVAAVPSPAKIATDNTDTGRTGLLMRTWQPAPLSGADTHAGRESMEPGGLAQIILIDWSQSCAAEISSRLPCELKLAQLDTTQDMADVVGKAFLLLLRHLQTLPATAQQLLLVLPDTENNHLYAPLVSLWQTALRERAAWQGRVIWLPPATPSAAILSLLQAELQYIAPAQCQIRYAIDGSRQTYEIQVLPAPSALLPQPLASAGKVIWICGGQGGIGLHIARHLARQPRIKLVLSGRSACNMEQLQALRAQLQGGGEVDYLQLDIGDLAETQQAASMIRQRFGALHGVLHCAGVVQDALLGNKDEAQVDAVFRPKIAGTIALDLVTADDKLDFFVLCASIAGVSGSPGQADYAAANAFQDAFADYRARLQSAGLRSGLSMAVDWCAWQDGGMQQGQAQQQQLREQFGLLALTSGQGCSVLDLLHTAAAHTHALIVLQHEGMRYSKLFRIGDGAVPTPTPTSKRNGDTADIRKQVLEIFEEITRTPASRLDGNAAYHEFGIDSILSIKLTKRLAEYFGPQPDTLLYEHLNINRLCNYLAASTSDKH